MKSGKWQFWASLVFAVPFFGGLALMFLSCEVYKRLGLVGQFAAALYGEETTMCKVGAYTVGSYITLSLVAMIASAVAYAIRLAKRNK